jgi:hypothetical protein
MLTTQFHLVPRSRIVIYASAPPYVFTALLYYCYNFITVCFILQSQESGHQLWRSWPCLGRGIRGSLRGLRMLQGPRLMLSIRRIDDCSLSLQEHVFKIAGSWTRTVRLSNSPVLAPALRLMLRLGVLRSSLYLWETGFLLELWRASLRSGHELTVLDWCIL